MEDFHKELANGINVNSERINTNAQTLELWREILNDTQKELQFMEEKSVQRNSDLQNLLFEQMDKYKQLNVKMEKRENAKHDEAKKRLDEFQRKLSSLDTYTDLLKDYQHEQEKQQFDLGTLRKDLEQFTTDDSFMRVKENYGVISSELDMLREHVDTTLMARIDDINGREKTYITKEMYVELQQAAAANKN